MNRGPLGPLDTPIDIDGDRGWKGVNLRLDPELLPPGWASGAVNMRFRNGTPETRNGSMLAPWMLNILSSTIRPWGTVYGRGEFRDPTTFREYVLIAADGQVYLCLQNNAPKALGLPAGVTITARCTFLQAFNVVLLLRGFGANPLVMDDVNIGFKAITQTDSGTGTLTIPRALRGVFAANRVFLLREDDTLVASDILDYTRYTIFNDFRVNQGDADKGVAIGVFGSSTILVLKERSVYRVDNIFGNLDEITFSLVTRRYGCVAADTVIDCGSDMLWLSQEGVASLTLTIQNEIQAAQGALSGKNRMFSEDIGPLIDRINGTYIQNSYAELWQDRYYLALPVDMAEIDGPEMATNQETLPSGVLTIAGLVVGQSYRWTPGSNDGAYTTTLACGSLTTTVGQVFTATATEATITVSVADSWFITDSLKRVAIGVNNILAHYDFQNQAWGGYDESELISFKHLFTASYVRRRRLFVIDDVGYVRLWEEDYTDRLAEPFVDVVVSAAPVIGNTIEVNSGEVVFADTAASSNAGVFWGALSLAAARVNIWGLGQPTGYSPDAVAPWDAPNTRPMKIENGVRFYSTSGVPVDVDVTGSWSSVTHYVEQQIQSVLETRGYNAPDMNDSKNLRYTLDADTWNPDYSAVVVSNGVNEESEIVDDSTRSRLRYSKPFNKAPWVPTNINDDFNTPYRGDYSIQQTGVDWEMYLHDGVRTNLHQAARHTVRAGGRDRSAKVRITCSQGRIKITASRLERLVYSPRNGVKN